MVTDAKTPQTLLSAMRYFTPDVADAYVASIKWPHGPCCPKCGSFNVGAIKSRRRFQCREKGCRKQFSLIADTIMEGTHPNCGCRKSGHHTCGCEGAGGNCRCPGYKAKPSPTAQEQVSSASGVAVGPTCPRR